MARAWYESRTDIYIIDFSDDPAFPSVRNTGGPVTQWSMFTHGVCTAVVDNHLDFSMIAIFGRHLPEPGETRLPDLIERAAAKLYRMGEEAQPQVHGSLLANQCVLASETLRRERDELVRALLVSRQS